MQFSWVCKGWSWWEVELVNVFYLIPYSFLRQDTVVAWTTFYKVAGLKSLANHWLRSYHTYKVWCGGANKGLIECDKTHEWFTDYSTSKLCKKAKLQAGIKPTALCSAIDKENSIESLLDFATLYIQLLLWLCTLFPIVLACQLTSLSHAVTVTCDYVWHDHSVTLVTLLWLCDCHVIFPMLYLAILPSYNKLVTVCKGEHLRNTIWGESRLNLQSFYLYLYYK